MSAGRGSIAVALVVFASWKAERLMLGAYLFGAVTILQFHAQGLGITIPVQLLAAPALSRHHHRARRHFA